MRSILLVGALTLVGAWTAPCEAAAQPRKARTVQLIVMGGDPVAKAPSGNADTAEKDLVASAPMSDAAPLPAAFRTHDLSRQWVAFEMANSFSSAAGTETGMPAAGSGQSSAAVGPSDGTILPPPAIAVPRWMTDGVAFSSAATSFSAGCAPAAYRPSGFLDARTEYRRLGYYGMMSSIACEYGIPVGLFDAMIIRESAYEPGIYSAKKAFGLTQLMPDTAAAMGVDRYDTEQNLRGGARYLRDQLDRFGAVHLALAAYNAGPGRVKGGFVPRIAETQAYVDNVLLNWRRLAGLPRRATVQGMTAAPAQRPFPTGRVATVSSY